jgi:3-deoxy-manno-octulosonate cytidylyltransferase (CMP-KDO synthetase)
MSSSPTATAGPITAFSPVALTTSPRVPAPYLTPTQRCTSQIVIPARLASTRLPQKLLLRETGKPLIQHTFEAARTALKPQDILVAVDSQQLADVVSNFGGRAIMTDPALPSGTDRVACVAEGLPEVDIFVNVQGDEPEITGEAIDQLIAMLEADPTASIATLMSPIRDRSRLENPACVKVVSDGRGRALYFSRSPIPHARSWDDVLLNSQPAIFNQHIGLYAYRRAFLMQLATLPKSPLEELEKLEQLRFLQAGYSILVSTIEHAPKGIDTPDDYRAFVRRTSVVDRSADPTHHSSKCS